ncbi:MAG: hypothetical protein LBK95_08645 [Bifidobacteriaceae bacterium]|jgi:hypothetical protein|nr:hypothetical protein [Bifidobacteriaceae bacterium]
MTVVTRAVLAAAVAALLLSTYLWASTQSRPRDVPLGLSAPEPVAAQLAAALDQAAPGGFDVRPVGGADEARSLIRDRELYGAIVVGPEGASVLTASAASAPVARMLETLPGRLAQAGVLGQSGQSGRSEQSGGAEDARDGGPTAQDSQAGGATEPGAAEASAPAASAGQAPEAAAGANATVEDVAPLAPADPNGAAFVMLVIVISVVGLLSGMVTALTVRGTARRLATALACGAAVGLVAAAVAGPWLGVLPNGYWAHAGLVALTCGAVALAVTGVHSLVGLAGVPLVALAVFAGNPFSGAQGGTAMLPDGWWQVGQALPSGALASSLRSVVYFGGTGSGLPLVVLGSWLVAGALALVAGWWLRRPRHASWRQTPVEACP